MCDEKYESLGVYTIGGTTGSYVLRSPVNTELEYCVTGAFVNAGSGFVALNAGNPTLLQMTTGVQVLGLAGGADNNAFEGLFIFLSATQNYLPPEIWIPLGRGANINVAMTISGGSAFLTIALRRSLTRVIPQIPKKPRSTHTPLSAKRARTFYQGWNEADESRVVGAAINVKPNEDTSTSDRHMPPGINPMAELQRRAKRLG